MPARDPSGRPSKGGTYRRPPKKRGGSRPAPSPAPKPDVTLGGDNTPRRSGHAEPKSAPSPAPRPDVTQGGDNAPRGTGHTTRKQRIKENRRKRRAARRQIERLTRPRPTESPFPGLSSLAERAVPRDRPEESPFPGLSAKATESRDREIQRDIAKLLAPEKKVTRSERTRAAERLESHGVVKLPKPYSLKEWNNPERLRKQVIKRYKQGGMTKAEKERSFKQLKRAGFSPPDDLFDKAVELTAAPALEVLDQSTRPAEFVAGAFNRQVKKVKEGKPLEAFNPVGNVKAGIESGVTRKKRTTTADVLRTAGAEGALRDVGLSKTEARIATEAAGFAGDVLLDPLTYTSFGVTGAGKVAAKAAQKAGNKAYATALAGGATRKEAKKAGSRAARKAYSKAPKNRGVTVGVGRRRTSGRATAAVSRAVGIPAVARKASAGKAAEGARKAFPIRPRDISEEEWATLKAADREQRGTILHGTRRASRKARAVRKALGGAERRLLPERQIAGGKVRLLPRRRAVDVAVSAKVRDAIEANDLSKLTTPERKAAEAIIREQEVLLKARREAGEKPARYRKRTLREQAEEYAEREMGAIRTERGLERQAKNPAAPALAVAEKRLSARLNRAEAKLAKAKEQEARLEGRLGAKAASYRATQRRRGAKPQKGRTDLTKLQGERLLGAQSETIFAQREVSRLRRHLADVKRQRAEAPETVGVPLRTAEVVRRMRERGARFGKEPEGYVYRQSLDEISDRGTRKRVAATGQPLRAPVAKAGRGRAARRTTTLEDFRRGERRPLAAVRAEDPTRYVEDIETTLLAKATKDIERVANSRYRNRVLSTGRKLKPKTKWDRQTESIYTVKDGRLVDVSTESLVSRKGARHPEVVVLKKAVAEHANEQMESVGRIPFLDPTTNAVKWVLTIPNPQYWARNLYGGLVNAFESGVPVRHLARDMPTVARVNRRVRKLQRAEETLGAKARKGGTVKVLPKGGRMKVDDFVAELERVNISGGGLTQELLGASVARRGKAQAFEDAPRIAAYIHARRAGKSADDSAAFALKSQFDYGDLSRVEQKVFRRIFPFYTWRSRNTVLQVKTLIQRPGKIANIEKLRDALAGAAGLGDDWQEHMTKAQKLGVPLPMPFTMHIEGMGDKPVLIFPALPVTDLNLLTLNFADLGQQVGGSVHPLPKAAVEFLTGYSIFFRDQIEGPYNRWTAAPDYLVAGLPSGVRKRLVEEGVIRKGKDRWTGEMTWQWRAKTSYLLKLTPITSVGIMQATSGRNRAGRSSGQQLFAWLTGLRPQPYVPKMSKLYETLYDQRDEVQTKIDDLVELRVHKRKGWSAEKNSGEAGWDTPEYARLKKQQERLDEEIFKLEKELGKKDPTRPQSMPQPKQSKYEEWKDSTGSTLDKYREWKKGGKSDYDKYKEWASGR